MYGGSDYSLENLVEYKKQAIEYLQAGIELGNYRCHKYPRDPAFCVATGEGRNKLSLLQGSLSRIEGIIAGRIVVPGYEQYTNGILESVEMPELLPQVFAEEQVILSDDIIQILNDIENGVIVVPDWFRNNIEWVKNGHITQQEFRTAYNHLVDTQIVHEPTTQEPINESITDNMVTQKIDYFTIENGRAIGQITFTATQNFNPFYYNKNIVNIIQFKDRNGANILPTVKQNNLRFTETERTETIQYDESVNDNIFAIGSSFVWSSATAPTSFSKQLEFEIREKEPVKPIASGFMAAGVAGAIAGLVLLGFIVDSKVGK